MLAGYGRQSLHAIIVEVQTAVRGTVLGQVVAVDVFVGAVDDEKQPEELVAALGEDVLPHAAIDDAFPPPMGLQEQQIWGRGLCCQSCMQPGYMWDMGKCNM